MTKRLAYVRRYPASTVVTCHYWHASSGQWQRLDLDTPDWLAWLAQEKSFRYTDHLPDDPSPINFTVRPEKRGQHTYWQGWKTIRGQTTKKYLGKATKVPRPQLDAVGIWFAQQCQLLSPGAHNQQRYKVAVDLVWLAEGRVLVDCG